MKTILHATDFSNNAITALKYAHTLSLKIKALLYVIHVFDTSTLSSDLNETYLLPYKETLALKNEKLKQFCKTHLGNNYKTTLLKTYAVEHTNIVRGIISKIKATDASLLVIGAKEKSAFEELLTGNTIKQLIEKTPCPVLIIPGHTTLYKLETIVYATDFEEEDISAIFKLSQIAKIFNATIKIVHISSKKDSYAQQELEWFKDILKQKVTYPNIEFRLLLSEEICHTLNVYLDEVNADLLAMLERKNHHFFKQLFHKGLVKKMESVSTIPLISYNEINY